MKAIIFSDSHGNIKNIIMAIEKFKDKIDIIIHLGDYITDTEKIKDIFPQIELIGISGNNDFSSVSSHKSLEILGNKIFMTHGHEYNVYFGIERLFYKAIEINANIVLYGHTHKYFSLEEDGILILNPGSISCPRGGIICTFAILDIEEGHVTHKFFGFFGEDIKQI